MGWYRRTGLAALTATVGAGAWGCGSDESSSPTSSSSTSSTTSTGTGGGTSSGGAGGQGAGGSGGAGGFGAGGGGELAYECPPNLDPCPAFPASEWATRSAAELGIDESKIDAFVQATGNQQGVLTRYGYRVHSWGNDSGKFGWASASKPLFATLLLFAVQEGKLGSVDDPVGDWSWTLSSPDQGMTFRQLANMTSGYALSEGPGQAWAYNDYAIKLYALTLVERVFTDGTADQIIGQGSRLGPLDFQDGDVFALQNGAPRVHTSPRDFARIGWFWLNHGR
ncbi:MAG: beta-lactamase family protein, partial [Deltaproteobacteria bacterium]|nr:beta-lactamase family protein [Deltaproteobacteria bacterium]